MPLQVYPALARAERDTVQEGGKIMNNDYAAGLAVGIIAAIVFFGIIWKFNKNKMWLIYL